MVSKKITKIMMLALLAATFAAHGAAPVDSAEAKRETEVAGKQEAAVQKVDMATQTEPRDAMCVVCQEDWSDKNKPECTLPCGHTFHSTCILDWLVKNGNNTCPTCRTAVIEENNDEALSQALEAAEAEVIAAVGGDAPVQVPVVVQPAIPQQRIPASFNNRLTRILGRLSRFYLQLPREKRAGLACTAVMLFGMGWSFKGNYRIQTINNKRLIAVGNLLAILGYGGIFTNKSFRDWYREKFILLLSQITGRDMNRPLYRGALFNALIIVAPLFVLLHDTYQSYMKPAK